MQLSKMLVASSTWHSTLCVLTWKPKVTPHNRLLFQLAVSKHPIVETESGSSEKMWRTPTAEGDGGKRGLGKMTVKEAKQKNRQVSLSREIREEPIRKMPPNKKNLWSTPTAFDAHNIKGERKKSSGGQIEPLQQQVRMWPTPTARDWKGGRKPETLKKAGRTENNSLPDKVNAQIKTTGSLNPDWVEWLMGYGQGYTDPDNNDSFTLGSHQGFPNEPEIARVTTENQYRKDRLKALGNSIVPQIAYHIGLAILEQERH